MTNLPALIKLRDALVTGKKKHDQTTWAKIKIKGKWMPDGVRRMEIDCATSACAAGHACLLAGDVFIIRPGDVEEDDAGRPFYHPTIVRTYAGKEVDLEKRARQLLGLDAVLAGELFYAYHSHQKTIDILDRLIAGEDLE